MVRAEANGTFATLLRWLDVLLLGLLGASTFQYAGPWLSALFAAKISDWLQPGSELGLWVLVFGIGLTLIAMLHRVARTSLGHVRHLLAYPPLPVAVVSGLLIVTAFPTWLSPSSSYQLSFSEATIAAGGYVLFWFCQVVAEYLWGEFSRVFSTKPVEPKRTATSRIPDSDLKHWLRREDAVTERGWDLFGHTAIAERLVDRLLGDESTITLQGEFGSGKSSICAMSAAEAKRRSAGLIFVQASCWGFESAAAAQKRVLDAILQEVGREVDCVSIRHLPSDYLDAVTSHVGWLKSFLQLGARERSPVEQLQRLSPKLAAIRRRVVLVVEDVDRTGQDFDIGQIQSLLMQFREVRGLSFILAISPLQQIDFAKLCDHVETVPALERGQILRLIHQVRELALREYPAGVMLNQLDPLVAEDDNYKVFDRHLEYHWPWQLSLCGVLNRPRLLKHALRRVLDAWSRLHGEVHFDDLLSIAALRTGAPEVFTFLCDRYPFFAPAMKSPDPHLRAEARVKLKDDLQAEWQKLSAAGRFDARAVAGLLKDILPSTGAATGQSAVHTVIHQSSQSDRRGDVYARRLFTERCESEEISDQRILGLMQRSRSEPDAIRELAEAITDSHFASVAFEHFARVSSYDHVLPLLSEVYAVIRKRHGPEADRDELPGFFAPWRLVVDNPPAGFEEWIVGELKKCLPGHLRLATNIYYYWLGTDKHTRAERELPRKAILDTLQATWPSIAPADLAAGFDQNFPYVLFHLVFTSDYTRSQDVPLGDAADWAWSAPLLLRGAQASPSVMLPQILIAVGDESKRNGPIPVYEFDQNKLTKWFGPLTGHLLALVAAGFSIPPSTPEQSKYVLNLAIQKAKDASAGAALPVKPEQPLSREFALETPVVSNEAAAAK